MLSAILERNRLHRSRREGTGRASAPSPETGARARRPALRFAAIAAAVCLSLALGATAMAVRKWYGYANTEGLSKPEVEKLLLEYAPLVRRQLIEPDGTVHYLDEQGGELMVLSAADAAKYDAEIRQAREQAVRESTSLIDVDAMESIPNGITVIPVSEGGSFHDFALGNGYMVLLCAEGETPFSLRAGDTVTVRLQANDVCGIAFFPARDGIAAGHEYAKAQDHRFSYTVPADGEYCFALMYASAGASSFTDCSLTVAREPRDG